MVNNVNSDRFLGMGGPWFYLIVTIGALVPAYGFVRQNAEVLFQRLAREGDLRTGMIKVGVVTGAALVNVLMAIFLYFSVVSQYALISTIVSLIACVSVFHPDRAEYSKMVAGTFVAWTAILTGIVLGSTGIILPINAGMCKLVYNSYADVMCKDGWLTFCTFCAIIVVGGSFLMNLLLIDIAITDAAVVVEAAKAEGTYSSISDGYGATESTRASAANFNNAPIANNTASEQQAGVAEVQAAPVAGDAVYTPAGANSKYEAIPDDN